jgi:phosphohistidine phosphatase
MNLYLVQHGESLAKDIDPVRPLSEQGRRHVRKMARFAAKSGCVNLTHILHSGKLRARQTAEIFSESLGISPPVHSDDLAPMDDPAIWAQRCEELAEDTMLVGHLPHLARLAGTLLCGGPETAPINFRMGGIVALAREERQWSLQWMVVPDILINP